MPPPNFPFCMRLYFLLALPLLLGACGPRNADSAAGAPPRASDDRVVGTVAVVGSAPVSISVVIRDAQGDVRVDGPLRDEIRRLDGAVVEARGQLSGRVLRASSYEIRSVNGRAVEAGTLERGPSGALQLRRSDGEVVVLSSVPPGLRAGQKVWIQGPATVAVQSYGVITP